MPLAAGTCYASKHDHQRKRYIKKGKYELSFYINFDEPRSVEKKAKQEKVLVRMKKHYGVRGTNINFLQEKPKYHNRFRTIELVWAYSYLCRIRITDMFNPHIEVRELMIKNENKKYS